MKKITFLIKSEGFKYLIFGVLTTLVYYIFMEGSFFIFNHPHLPAGAISETIGQVVSIIFAFFTNKIWVFEHKSEHLFLDFISFSAGRLVFMLLAIVLKWWFIDTHPEILLNLTHLSKPVVVLGLSLGIQVLNIILNYFYSKFIVFRKSSKINE